MVGSHTAGLPELDTKLTNIHPYTKEIIHKQINIGRTPPESSLPPSLPILTIAEQKLHDSNNTNIIKANVFGNKLY